MKKKGASTIMFSLAFVVERHAISWQVGNLGVFHG